MPVHKKLFYEVVQPYMRFLSASHQAVLEDRLISEYIAFAQEAVTAAYHFTEQFGLSWPHPHLEALSERLRDITDTRKHVVLRKQDRQITLSAAIVFEFNDEKMLRFVCKSVDAHNNRFGTFDVADTLRPYVEWLATQARVNLDVREPELMPFICEEVLMIQHHLGLEGFTVKFVKRDAGGNLVPQDTDFEFEMKELIDQSEFWGKARFRIV